MNAVITLGPEYFLTACDWVTGEFTIMCHAAISVSACLVVERPRSLASLTCGLRPLASRTTVRRQVERIVRQALTEVRIQ